LKRQTTIYNHYLTTIVHLYHSAHIYCAVMKAVCYSFIHHIALLRDSGVSFRHVVMSESALQALRVDRLPRYYLYAHHLT